jgi:long-chain acyl-CoA synthetase
METVHALCKEVDIPRVIVTKLEDFSTERGKNTKASLDLESTWHHFSTLLDNCSDMRQPRVSINPEDPAVIQFTGGTTGLPKGAILTHGNIIYATMFCSLWSSTIALIPPERRTVLALLPFYHVYGNICIINWSMMMCATQIHVPRFQIDEIMDLIKSSNEISYFPTVPTIISAIINHPSFDPEVFGRKIKTINSGGGPIAVELIREIKNTATFYSEGWGMSETTSVGISNPLMSMSKTGAIGIPIPGVDVRLVDLVNGTEDVPRGEPGEVIIKGPNVMKGYWNHPEETADQLKDGWLYTGDIGTQDEDDYVYLVDRKKDMIIAGGFNIYPREVDEILFQHPKVEFAVTVGIPDTYRGETVKAFVVLKEGQGATEKEIITFCKEKMAPYKVPKMVEFRDSLPQSAVGKVLRRALRDEEMTKKKE